jgi:hypothetical protein
MRNQLNELVELATVLRILLAEHSTILESTIVVSDNIKINTLEKLFNYKICGIAIKILCKLDFFKYALHFNNNTLYFIINWLSNLVSSGFL